MGNDSKDVKDILYRPMPRFAMAPTEDIRQCLRDAMTMHGFNGNTSKFVEDLISEGGKMVQTHIARGILTRYPKLTENDLFALVVFTIELRAIANDANERMNSTISLKTY